MREMATGAPGAGGRAARAARGVRAAVAGLLGVACLLLAGCQAQGAGTLGAPAPGSDATGTWPGTAAFGFTYRCEVRDGGRVVATGELLYRDAGPSTVTTGGTTRTFGAVALTGTADATPAGGACGDSGGLPAVRFEGQYRQLPGPRGGPVPPDGRGTPTPPDGRVTAPPFVVGTPAPTGPPQGTFVVLVFDQGPRGGRPGPDFTGDAFAIELFGGPYDGYTRAGYIERGDVRVR